VCLAQNPPHDLHKVSEEQERDVFQAQAVVGESWITFDKRDLHFFLFAPFLIWISRFQQNIGDLYV
jgi:hypothetical protein